MNPILVRRALVTKVLLRFLVTHDIDNNVVRSNPCLWLLEQHRDLKFVEACGLEQNIFERVRTGDIATRDDPFDLSISIPVIAQLSGVAWSEDECMEHALRYLAMIEEVEQQAGQFVFPGVLESLTTIAGYPQILQAALTDCPLWLAVLRLYYAGLLPKFQAVAGVRTFVPDYMRGSKYWRVAETCVAWTERKMAEKAEGVRLLLALDQESCKPSAAALLKMLQTDNFAPANEVVVVMSGDKPKDGRVAENIRPLVREAHFVHTRIAEHDPLKDGDPTPRLVIDRDFQEILALVTECIAA
jgi:hypothetical protein